MKIIGISLGVIALTFLVLAIVWFIRKKKELEKAEEREIPNQVPSATDLQENYQ